MLAAFEPEKAINKDTKNSSISEFSCHYLTSVSSAPRNFLGFKARKDSYFEVNSDCEYKSIFENSLR